MSLHDLRNDTNSFDLTVTYDDFLHQLLSGLQPTGTWPDTPAAGEQIETTLSWDAGHFDDQSAFLSSKLRQHQITAAGGGHTPSSALKSLQLPKSLTSAGESAVFQNDNIGDSSFKSLIEEFDKTSFQNLFHGFTGSLTSDQTQQFRNLSASNFESPVPAATLMSQLQTGSTTAGGGGAPSQPRQRVRARRGQATDPHSIAERLRRERIAERMKALQELVPNANKTDKATMLDDIIDYVKFLQLQVKALSMSRLGGATIATEGGGRDCGQQCDDLLGRSSIVPTSSSNNETTTVMENQVVKLMEEDMGSAMQYLQGKGLCLMPVSLANTISTARGHTSGSNIRLGSCDGGEAGGPSSPSMSVQSAIGMSLKDSP